MKFLFRRSREQATTSVADQVERLASAYHDDWRSTRLREDGAYEPRVKTTKDEVWIAAHGTDQVDIANTDYPDLPIDWQEENKAAATVVVGMLGRGAIDLSVDAQRLAAGGEIHDAWLSRNEWARGGELDVPFGQLPPHEQAKDIAQLLIARQVFPQA